MTKTILHHPLIINLFSPITVELTVTLMQIFLNLITMTQMILALVQMRILQWPPTITGTELMTV